MPAVAERTNFREDTVLTKEQARAMFSVTPRRSDIHSLLRAEQAEKPIFKEKDMQQPKQRTLSDRMRQLKKADEVTYNHSVRCGNYLALMAEEMGKSPEEVQTFREAGYAHDLGKLKVMDAIQSTVNFRENPEEGKKIMEQTRDHVRYGEGYLKNLADYKPEYSQAAKYHHCWYKESNRGYSYETRKDPSRQAPTGKQVPEVAQMLSVIDCYDALTDNSRSYRKEPLSDDTVHEIMQKGLAEGQFNPKYYQIFEEKILPQIKAMDPEQRTKLQLKDKKKPALSKKQAQRAEQSEQSEQLEQSPDMDARQQAKEEARRMFNPSYGGGSTQTVQKRRNLTL